MVRIHTNPESAEAYRGLSPGRPLALGSVVSAVHQQPNGDAGPVLAMVKGADGRWTYVATDSSGYLDPDADLGLCARCHEEAPCDGLFGPRFVTGEESSFPPTP